MPDPKPTPSELSSEEIAKIEVVLRQAGQNAHKDVVAAFLASIRSELRERGYEWDGSNVRRTG
jgi:hypothetical protein